MMKNSIKNVLFVLVAAIIFIYSYPAVAWTECTFCQQESLSSQTNVICTPQTWVEVLPAFFEKSPADHTYIKAVFKNGNCEAWPCFGRDSGGKQLSDTHSDINEMAISVIGNLANTSPCKWPNHYYLVVGVCHQLANRGLYYTDKIVHNARMYKWISHIYNTYGACFWPLKKYCVTNCLEHAGPWPPIDSIEKRKEQKVLPIHPEVVIYRKYFTAVKKIKNDDQHKGLYQKYIDELLKSHIDDRLGLDFPPKKALILKKLRDDTLAWKERIDYQLLELNVDGLGKEALDVIIKKYNNVFNTMLSQYAEVLTDKEYYDFLGLKKGKQIDMRWFLPDEG